jgi:hypothetical protein
MSTNKIYTWRQYFFGPFHNLLFGAGSIGDNAARGKMGSYLGEDLPHRQNRRGDDDEFGLPDRTL